MAKANKAKVDDYRGYDEATLTEKIADQELQLKKLHFSHSVNPIENPLTIRGLRRNIARLKTEQHRRTLGF